MTTIHQQILGACSPYCASPHKTTEFYPEDDRATAVSKMLAHAASLAPVSSGSVTHAEILAAMQTNNRFSKFRAVAQDVYARNLHNVLTLLPARPESLDKAVQLYADVLDSCCTAQVNHHVFSVLFAYLYQGTLTQEYASEIRLFCGVVCRETF